MSLDKRSGIKTYVNQEQVGIISESGELEIDTPKQEFELSFMTNKTKRKSRTYIINNNRIDRGVVEMKFVLRIINIITVVILSIDFVFGDLIFPDMEPFSIDTYIGFGLIFLVFILNFFIFKNNYFDVRFYDKDSNLITVEQYKKSKNVLSD